jgi:hypothetical protein
MPSPGATTAAVAVTTGAVVAAASGFPEWAVPPMAYEILATLVLGVIATWTREIVRHYDEDSAHTTSVGKCLIMIIPGTFAGFLGGEIAQLAGYQPTDIRDPSWLFVLTIGYIGPPAMNMLCQLVLGIMQKGIERFGLDFEKQQARKAEEYEANEKREFKQANEADEMDHRRFMEEQNMLLQELKNDPNPPL